MNRIGRAGALLAMAMPCVFAAAATPVAALDSLKAYEGTWRVHTESFLTPYSKPNSETTTLQNDCWRSAGFYSCRQSVDGDSKALLVFTYDATQKSFTSYPIPAHGGAPGQGRLLIDGATWTFPWEQAENGTTTYFRVVNVFQGTRDIEFRSEYSVDKKSWTMMSRGHETKLPS
jgi:hypothetical protein